MSEWQTVRTVASGCPLRGLRNCFDHCVEGPESPALPPLIFQQCCTGHERQLTESCITAMNGDAEVRSGPLVTNAAPGTYRQEGRRADFRCTSHYRRSVSRSGQSDLPDWLL
jgi:hypothetical protein